MWEIEPVNSNAIPDELKANVEIYYGRKKAGEESFEEIPFCANFEFKDFKVLRTEVRGDFNIHGTKFFHNAVFHQKSKKYDVVSLPVPLVGQKTRPPREILTWLFITEDPFRRHFQ